jgi:outer membrane translocation and assembly module TamA
VGALTTAGVTWTRDTTRERLFPRRGFRTRLAVEWTPPGIGSATHFVRADAGASVHTPLGDEIVLATRLRTGVAAPAHGAESLIPNKRFFAGGSTSMRGFKRRQLGPLDDQQRALGGETLLEAAAEIRFPLVGRLKGAVFVDAGQVWSDRTMRPKELEIAVGPGLIFLTVIGPVRTDLGVRLTERAETQPGTVFHVSIGHPF